MCLVSRVWKISMEMTWCQNFSNGYLTNISDVSTASTVQEGGLYVYEGVI